MPYIKKEERRKFDSLLVALKEKTRYATAGELNYLISSIIWDIFDHNRSYSRANELIGMLECVKQEFFRRRVNEYEQDKISENGDL